MMKVSQSLEQMINENPLFQFGLQRKIFNLSRLAELVKAPLEARTKKSIQKTTLVMALSRLQRKFKPKSEKKIGNYIQHIAVQSGLMTFSLEKTPETHNEVNNLYDEILKRNGYITITQGLKQITVITEIEYRDIIKKYVGASLYYVNYKICSVGVEFFKEYLETPGMLFSIIEQASVQNINIIEVASTATEFMVYVNERDAKLLFDTLYGAFMMHNR